ncbi:phage protease [Acinetobacter vivianii]
MNKTLLAATCSFELPDFQDYLVLIPEGIFRSEIDGRPYDAPHWILTPERGHLIAAALNQREIDTVIDYEHATLKSKNNGEAAPAAGWLLAGGFIYKEGVGLCSSKFDWLEKAKAHIEAKEYKYLSPVFLYNSAGEIITLINLALTNTPAIENLQAKIAAAAQEFFAQNLQDSTMDELLEHLRWMLNLPLAATPEEIKAELSKLQQQITEKTGVAVAANSQNLFDAVAAIDQLKVAANSQSIDMTKFVPMDVYLEAKNEVTQVAQKAQAKELDDLILAACSDGRLTGTKTIDWIKKQAVENPEFAKAHIEGLPKMAALTQQQTKISPTTPPSTDSSDPLQEEV